MNITPRSGSPTTTNLNSISKDANNDATISVVQLSRPYLTSSQIKSLVQQTNNSARDLQPKLQAFSLILSIGNYMRFPIRTMGTAMILFQRFYLFNSLHDFPVMNDTAHACLFVAAKMEDTLKKLKDILLASYYLKHPAGPDISVDSPVIEDQRRKLISLERHVLETMSFDFRIKHPQPYIIKITKHLKYPATVAETAWLASIDSYRTLAPLKATPHAIALACIYIAATLFQQDTSIIEPAKYYYVHIRFLRAQADYADVILEILELYIDSLAQTLLHAKYKSAEQFMSMRIDVNKRLNYARERNYDGDPLTLRDFTIGDKGAIRFILDWDRQRLETGM
ncbi:cyclin-like protein [Lipomyces arxii]|uniref:cyclin-like protein n=1 Tax=Lipomyces arxii TaxID=56418 RepID=UPI0034CE1B67